MSIISISVKDQTLNELEQVIDDGGYKGRSDAFRFAIKLLSREQKQQQRLLWTNYPD